MSNWKDFIDIEHRTFRESLQDGLMEIMIGIILMGMAGASLYLPLVALYLVPLLFWMPISEAIRKRYTYPRIGYFKLKKDPARRVLPGVFLYQALVFASVGLSLFILFGNSTDPKLWFRAMPLIFGMMLVGAFLHTAGKTGSRRPYIYASFSMIVASIFSIIEFEGLEFPYLFGEFGAGLVLYLSIMGSLLTIIGIYQFFSFVLRHPVATDSDLLVPEGC